MKVKQPTWTAAMLSTLVDEPFSDKDWVFEKKYDGIRCLAFRAGDQVILLSRNQLRLAYPEIREALQKQKCRFFIMDGEIVAHKGDLESFSLLQERMNLKSEEESRKRGIKVAFYAFDLLFFDGRDLRSLTLLERKKILSKNFSFKDPIFFSKHIAEKGEKLFQKALKMGWEGVMAKKALSTYQGKRSRDWMKFKAFQMQEFVVSGYTLPQGSRKGFGALLIGYYEKGTLKFAGKVGTGYTEEMLDALSKKLKKINRKECPFAVNPKIKGALWVKPSIVAEIGFTEWTKDGKLRHPRFMGLRYDKSPKQVKRERGK